MVRSDCFIASLRRLPEAKQTKWIEYRRRVQTHSLNSYLTKMKTNSQDRAVTDACTGQKTRQSVWECVGALNSKNGHQRGLIIKRMSNTQKQIGIYISGHNKNDGIKIHSAIKCYAHASPSTIVFCSIMKVSVEKWVNSFVNLFVWKMDWIIQFHFCGMSTSHLKALRHNWEMANVVGSGFFFVDTRKLDLKSLDNPASWQILEESRPETDTLPQPIYLSQTWIIWFHRAKACLFKFIE